MSPSNAKGLAPFWARPGMYAFNLVTMFLDCYGKEGLYWLPETIEMTIREDFGVDLSPASFDRLMTGINILTSNSFFVSESDFTRECVALAGTFAPEDLLELPDCLDVAWGITEALLLHPPEGENPFSPEIVGYIAHALQEEGITNPPDVLRIASSQLADLANQVSYDYSDDPEMFGMISQMESSKTDDINKTVRARLTGLLQQLQALPLRSGKTGFVAALLGKLPHSDEPLPLPS